MTEKRIRFLPVNCPVLDQAREADNDARRLNRSLRRMRKAMDQCTACARKGDCPALLRIHTRINAVLLEIYQEWDLT